MPGAFKAYLKTSTFQSTKNVKANGWIILMVRKRKKMWFAPSTIITLHSSALDYLIKRHFICSFLLIWSVQPRRRSVEQTQKILPPLRKLQGTVTRRLMGEILSAFNSAVGSPFSCPHCCLKNQEREPGTKDLMSRNRKKSCAWLIRSSHEREKGDINNPI